MKALLEKTTLGGLFPDGITEDAYKAIKEKLGLPPTCNCPERIKWLNKADKLGRKWKARGIEWLKKRFSTNASVAALRTS